MTKVMLVCSSQVSVPPQKGGAIEEIVFEIAKSLGRGMKPLVVSRTDFEHPSIKCVYIKSKIRKNKLAAIIEDFRYGLKCVKAIQSERPDIVHMNTTFTSLAITQFLPKEDRPLLIYTSHSPAWTVPDSEIGRINIIFNKLEASVMRHSDVVTAVSDSMRKGIIQKAGMEPGNVKTIPNFARTAEFSPKYGKSWRKGKGIAGKMVLFVGKLTETKGIRYMIEAIPAVIQKFPDATFAFVGGLEHEQALKRNPWYKMVEKLGIQKNEKFLGSVPREELPKIYASSDLFVLPTLREGMPMVLLEAAASGLPIVTTKISGIPEVVDEKSVVFVHRKDTKSLAYAITRILSDSERAKKMGAASRKVALRFRKEDALRKYQKIYKSFRQVYTI